MSGARSRRWLYFGNRERKTAFSTSPNVIGTGSPESLLVKSQYLLTAKVKHSALTADLLGVSPSSHYNKRSSVSQNSCFLTAILLFCDVLMDSALKNDDTTNNSNLVTLLARTVVGYCLSKLSSFFLRRSPLKRQKITRWPSNSSYFVRPNFVCCNAKRETRQVSLPLMHYV